MKGFGTAKNKLWVNQSDIFFRMLIENGVKKITIAGTCAEKFVSVSKDRRSWPKSNEVTIYGQSKYEMWLNLKSLVASTKCLAANGRIFFPIGIGEPPFKLASSIVGALLRDQPFTVTNAKGENDYIDVRDVGEVMALLAVNHVEGEVEIGSGNLISCEHIVNLILAEFDQTKQHLITIKSLPRSAKRFSRLMANTTRMQNEMGFYPSHGIKQSVSSLVRELSKNYKNSAIVDK